MIQHIDITDIEVRRKIKQKEICLGGNQKVKIFGTLKCNSGKRLKRNNRVFFISEKEAIAYGYRPCGHCMKTAYKLWIYLAAK